MANGTAEFGVGTQPLIGGKIRAVDFTFSTYITYDTLTSRQPIQLPYYGNLIRPLPSPVWTAIFTLVLVMTVVFIGIQRTYQYIDGEFITETEDYLTMEVPSLLDFLIKTFSTVTEPELIPWFPRWSTGMIVFSCLDWTYLNSFFFRKDSPAYLVCVLYVSDIFLHFKPEGLSHLPRL